MRILFILMLLCGIANASERAVLQTGTGIELGTAANPVKVSAVGNFTLDNYIYVNGLTDGQNETSGITGYNYIKADTRIGVPSLVFNDDSYATNATLMVNNENKNRYGINVNTYSDLSSAGNFTRYGIFGYCKNTSNYSGYNNCNAIYGNSEDTSIGNAYLMGTEGRVDAHGIYNWYEGLNGTANWSENQAGNTTAFSGFVTALNLSGGVTNYAGGAENSKGGWIGANIDPCSGGSTCTGINVNSQTTGGVNYGIRIGAASTMTLTVGSDNNYTTSAAGIAFGSSVDTNIYRGAANTLRTNDTLIVDGNVGVNSATPTSRLAVDGLIYVSNASVATTITVLCRGSNGQLGHVTGGTVTAPTCTVP